MGKLAKNKDNRRGLGRIKSNSNAMDKTVFSHPLFKTFLTEQEKYDTETRSWFQTNDIYQKKQEVFNFIPQY